jgi:RHS repeat-associated protein
MGDPFTLDNLDRVISRATPTPGNGDSSQRTGYLFDSLGQVIAITNSDNTLTYFTSLPTGEKTKTWGAREYPVEYAYDAKGRMTSMKTWQDFIGNSGTAVTSWTNDTQRGWLNNKRYADGLGTDYSYTPAGRLRQRTWARSLTTTYTTNAAGEVTTIVYSDGTTGNVTNAYDRLGRVTTVYSGTNLTTRLYSESGLLLSETQNGSVVSNRYDEFQRRTNVAVVIGGTVVVSTGYSYDSAGRLSAVTDGTNSATYSYVANSPLIAQILFKQNSTTRMTTSKSYDFLNRLLAITNLPSADSAVFFNYTHNNASQRTAITNADSSCWLYGYDSLGQVTNGNRSWSDSTPVLGQQFGYLFDDIGNRKSATSGGDSSGRSKRTQSYVANNLNQYTQRIVPGYLEILGSATNTATVTVNALPTSRKNDYYRTEVPTANSGTAAWQPITNVAVMAAGTNDYVTNWTGHLFLPKSPEVFGYDLDGNMTNDGRWSLTWDAENRLTRMQSLLNAPIGSSNRLTFIYDDQGRRISKVTETFVGGVWTITLSNRFIYDGWNLLAELNATNNMVINAFMWGLDLSDSMEGAGGVGGLLTITTTNAGTHFAGYDGNGNVTLLANASSGTTTANYEYDPFGNMLRATGPMTLLNPIRFSTKYSDLESGFNYYGYRFYNGMRGNWPNRDPIGELGFKLICINKERHYPCESRRGCRTGCFGRDAGKTDVHEKLDELNGYTFVKNTPIHAVDYLGLKGQVCVKKCCSKVALSKFRFIPEDLKGGPCHLSWPLEPGKCYNADALYMPGLAIKVNDLGTITVNCKADGSYKDWDSTWFTTSVWKAGDPSPPVDDWPCGGKNPQFPPYSTDPPWQD